jgi:hypothetical protein
LEHSSKFTPERSVQDGREQGVQLGGGLGWQVFHFVRREVIGEGSLIVRPATKNSPSPR